MVLSTTVPLCGCAVEYFDPKYSVLPLSKTGGEKMLLCFLEVYKFCGFFSTKTYLRGTGTKKTLLFFLEVYKLNGPLLIFVTYLAGAGPRSRRWLSIG